MNVLIVDDDTIALEILRATLEAAGHQVETACNGREALSLLRAGTSRTVISDWEMPEMSGIELCKAVRCEGFSGYIYFVLLTSHSDSDSMVAGLSAGADDFLSKPFRAAELKARMQTAARILALETRDMTIFALAKLAESRDPETGEHLERVRGYSQALAKELARTDKFRGDIDAEFINLIYMTSPLHDIGKVGIPDAILLKPGRLTDREFVIMKMHAEIGEQTLTAAMKKFPGTRFLELARDIAVSHHEWFDGTGYPRGLAGEQIPLCGRIMALADVYEALTARRVYKAAFTHERANGIIVGESGTHFDPDIVQAYMRIEDQFIAIQEQFNDHNAAAA
jgi:putative two-component system response regulator